MRKCLRLLTLSVCILGLAQLALAKNATIVYFFPFGIDTYIPITTETIKSSATQEWTITDASHVSGLMAILDHGVAAQFDNVNVRVAVITPGQTYYLNRDGVVKKGDRSYKIDMDAFWKFRASLADAEMHAVTGVVAHPTTPY